MPTNVEMINRFHLELTNFRDTIMPNAHRQFCWAIAIEVLKRVYSKNPVDTGLSQNNWQVTKDTPALGIVPITERTELGATDSATIRKGIEMIRSIDPTKFKIWITNNIHYIEILEEGHSQRQAPQGFVYLTLLEIEDLAARVSAAQRT